MKRNYSQDVNILLISVRIGMFFTGIKKNEQKRKRDAAIPHDGPHVWNNVTNQNKQ